MEEPDFLALCPWVCPFRVLEVACMAGCDRPCTVAYHGTKKATYLFGEWLWGNTSLRWIYCHAFDDNLPQFKSAVRHGVLNHLGAYRDRVAIDGVPQDVHLLGISREQWQSSPSRQRFLRLTTH